MSTERAPGNAEAARVGPSGDYRPEELGQEFDRGYDPGGYRRKQRAVAVAKCPTCHKVIALVAETEEWEQQEDATWEHAGWGQASAVCCNNLIVQSSNGYEVYPLPARRSCQNHG